MDAWRTSCPKLPVWEDANDRGLLTAENLNGRQIVALTSSGRAVLDLHGLLENAKHSARSD